jgi:hypothetical protein
MRRILLTVLAATACTNDSSDSSTSATDSTATSTDATSTSGDATTASTTAATATTTDAPTTTDSSNTTGAPATYCHGFEVDADAPFLSTYILGGESLVDGAFWPLECGAQGLWMFGIYPSLGGWDPMSPDVTFTIEVDVEGYNNNPDGHFFSGEVGYYIGCEDVLGGVLGVAPVFPPDELADLSVLDGLPAKVRVIVLADGDPITVEAMVTLQAPADLVMMGCEFGP